METFLMAGRGMPIVLDAIERLSICNIILLIIKPLHKWIIFFHALFSISITKLQCPLLCAVTSAIYIIITTFTAFILLLLITSQIIFVLILIIIIIIIIVNIIITINPPFSLSKLSKLWLSPKLLCSQESNQLSRLRRSENDQLYLFCWLCMQLCCNHQNNYRSSTVV